MFGGDGEARRADDSDRRPEAGDGRREADRDREDASGSGARAGTRPDLVRRAWRSKTLREQRGWVSELPSIEWRRVRKPKEFTSGRCWYSSRRITITIGTYDEGAYETVLHELTHAAIRHEGHTTRFWSILRALAAEVFPDVDFRYDLMPTDRGYRVDQWISGRIAGADLRTQLGRVAIEVEN